MTLTNSQPPENPTGSDVVTTQDRTGGALLHGDTASGSASPSVKSDAARASFFNVVKFAVPIFLTVLTAFAGFLIYQVLQPVADLKAGLDGQKEDIDDLDERVDSLEEKVTEIRIQLGPARNTVVPTAQPSSE